MWKILDAGESGHYHPSILDAVVRQEERKWRDALYMLTVRTKFKTKSL